MLAFENGASSMAHVQELGLLPAAAQVAGYSGRDRRETRKYGKEESLNVKELGGHHQGADRAEY